MLGKHVFLKYLIGLGGLLLVSNSQAVTKVSAIYTVAGSGTQGFAGENLAAASSGVKLNTPGAVVSDSTGTILYIADTLNHAVRKVDDKGNIVTLAGNGTAGFLGENVTASPTSVQFNTPRGIALDSKGNLYISDTKNNRIRKIDTANNITTFAGNGTAGFFGENISVVNSSVVQLYQPSGLAIDASDNMYVTDSLNHCVRKIDSSGIITTFAGNCGISGSGVENISANSTLTLLNAPQAVAVDTAGIVYIADTLNHRIRKVKQGTITTLAGNGTLGFGGENVPADSTTVQFNNPLGIAVTPSTGNVFIADTGNHRIRKVDVTANTIVTIAGNGTAGFAGDNGDASLSTLNYPTQMSLHNQILVFADTLNHRIRKIDGNFVLTVTKTGTGSGLVSAIVGATVPLNCGSVCSTSFTPDSNTILTLTATVDAGSTFTGWSGDCSGTASTFTLTMNADKTCTANFNSSSAGGSTGGTTGGSTGGTTGGTTGGSTSTAPPTGSILTVSNKGTGTGIISAAQGLLNTGIFCGGVCLEIYTPSTALTLTATAATGSIFTGWSGDCNATGKVLLDTDKSCSATFDLLPSANYPSSVQFATPSYSATDAQGKVTLLVTRAASSSGALSVQYSTADGSAVAGKDYTTSTNTLTWADGENAPKTIEIPLLVNSDPNLAATADFSVSLANVSAGASLGANPKATVSITRSPSSGAGSVQFSGTDFSANANSGNASIQVQRLGGSSGAVSVAYATTAGSAVSGVNYSNVNGTLNWASGDTQAKSFNVPLIAAVPQGGDKTVTLNLSSPTGGANLGAVSAATLKIIDTLGAVSTATNTSAGRLEFASNTYSVSKSLSYVSISINRVGGSQGVVSVTYSSANGTAVSGTNYTGTQNTISWANGDTQAKTFNIAILQDAQQTADKSFTVSLSNPTAGAQLGTVNSTTVQILNGTTTTPTPTPATASVLQLNSPSYSIGKDKGLVTLTVTRTVGTVGDLTVNYSTVDGTGLAGKDYLAAQGNLRWVSGDSGERKIYVGIYNNGLSEGDKTFSVKLGTFTGNTTLGSNTQATVLIKETNVTPIVQFSASNYSIDSSKREAILTVSRSGSSVGAVAVSYVSVDGTAIAGTDYGAISGVLNWENGDLLDKSFSVPLINNLNATENKTLSLRLSAVSNNLVLGDNKELLLTLINTKTSAADCVPSGNSVNCFYTNPDSSILTDFHVLSLGTLQGGTLAGKTTNEGIVQNINLSAGSTLTGGTLKGEILGQRIDPISSNALLSQVTVSEGTHLSNVTIGHGSVVSPNALFLERVRFEDNANIPSISDLSVALGQYETSVLGANAVRLTGDILVNSAREGILGAINSLYDLNHNGFVLAQRADTGFLELSLNGDTLRYAVLPMQVQHILGKQAALSLAAGLTIREDGYIRFITNTGRQINTHPVVQAPAAFLEILKGWGLPEVTMQSTGNLKITSPNDTSNYHVARADLIATASSESVGLFTQASPLSAATSILRFVFTSPNGGGKWQQLIYPAAADPAALYNLSTDKQSILYNTGEARLFQSGSNQQNTYHGIFNYLVSKGTPPTSGKTEILELPDLNQDNLADYLIIYPNGDQQVLYQLP
ncbi:MAG: Calx-beta domain-containing protein [Thiotrichaceae bacterium]|nr:Calx-beta domain-containing protein [Thiotrichaceae bacterium]